MFGVTPPEPKFDFVACLLKIIHRENITPILGLSAPPLDHENSSLTRHHQGLHPEIPQKTCSASLAFASSAVM